MSEPEYEYCVAWKFKHGRRVYRNTYTTSVWLERALARTRKYKNLEYVHLERRPVEGWEIVPESENARP